MFSINQLVKIVAFIFFHLILVIPDSNGCDCADHRSLERARKVSFQYSDIVFRGILLDSDSVKYLYRFKVLEIFKGGVSDSILIGKLFDSCSMFPQDTGEWIVYANILDNNFLDISLCSVSRSLQNPLCIGCYRIPDPLSVIVDESKIRAQTAIIDSIKIKAKEDWILELDILRQF